VTASQEAGVLEEQEEQMLHRVFGFADLIAGQIMSPRTEMVAVAAETSRDGLVAQFARGRRTRLLVYRGDLDHIVGFLYATDVIRALATPDTAIDAGMLAREACKTWRRLRFGGSEEVRCLRAGGPSAIRRLDDSGDQIPPIDRQHHPRDERRRRRA